MAKLSTRFCREHPAVTVLGMSEQITHRFYAQLHFYYMNPSDEQLSNEDTYPAVLL